MVFRSPLTRLLLLALLVPPGGPAAEVAPLRFGFDPATLPAGARLVTAEDRYSSERGCGFEPGPESKNVTGGVLGLPSCYFTTDLPAGNWRVTVTLRGAPGGGLATVKAELRRLMVGPVPLAEQATLVETMMVNTRNPRITVRNGVSTGRVNLKAPRETTAEAWAWDDRLTLEIHGAALAALEISPAAGPTVFLLGDSTVCDQSREPYTSWGQMLTRFFGPTMAIANHAESGETYRDSIGRRRLDKVISVMRPGDYLVMQFGHNDQKQIAAGTGGPFTTYVAEMKQHIAAVRRVGGIPIVVSPMERRGFTKDGKVVSSLADYARASRETAAAEDVAFIDLHALSRPFYEALGVEGSAQAFAAPGGKVDNTHHNNYGSYELARCVAAALGRVDPVLAAALRPEFKDFDPVHPDELATFAVPPSPNFTNQRPLGD